MTAEPTLSDTVRAEFVSAPVTKVTRKPQDFALDQRFHLWFAYPRNAGGFSWGDQVVSAESLEQAAVRVMDERQVDRLLVRKRYWSNRPAAEAEMIVRVFERG